jgi:hypothetical protein
MRKCFKSIRAQFCILKFQKFEKNFRTVRTDPIEFWGEFKSNGFFDEKMCLDAFKTFPHT